MRGFDRYLGSETATGFTLAEMLVAVAMGAALIAAAAGVFSLATQAVNTSQANTEIHTQLRILFSWLDRDFARIRLDGPLVIIPEETAYELNMDVNGDGNIDSQDTARTDRILFYISGDIPALTTPDHVSLALVLYGHDLWADDVVALADPSYEEMFDLVLTRWARLVVGDGTPDPSTEFYQLPASFADFIAYWYSSATPGDGFINTFQDRPDVTGSEDFAELLDHVLSFQVVGYAHYDDTGTFQYVNIDTSTALYTFDPHEDKPLYIDFNIVLRDANNRLEEDFIATYRVNLSSQ